jgi:hypothetical protein
VLGGRTVRGPCCACWTRHDRELRPSPRQLPSRALDLSVSTNAPWSPVGGGVGRPPWSEVGVPRDCRSPGPPIRPRQPYKSGEAREIQLFFLAPAPSEWLTEPPVDRQHGHRRQRAAPHSAGRP